MARPEELLRVGGFAERTLHDSRELIESLPLLSWAGVRDCYEAHLAGADDAFVLYTLLSFLRMPVASRVPAAVAMTSGS